MNEELKKCPFCGGKLVLWSEGLEKHKWFISCPKGCIILPAGKNSWFTSKESAINACNTRPSNDEVVKRFEERIAATINGRFGGSDTMLLVQYGSTVKNLAQAISDEINTGQEGKDKK